MTDVEVLLWSALTVVGWLALMIAAVYFLNRPRKPSCYNQFPGDCETILKRGCISCPYLTSCETKET